MFMYDLQDFITARNIFPMLMTKEQVLNMTRNWSFLSFISSFLSCVFHSENLIRYHEVIPFNDIFQIENAKFPLSLPLPNPNPKRSRL